ncbi:Trp biosynthesis-associated membrane protein [Aeromicrobium sp. CF3.5]|uniref:Trp biosynthesis-associated membrane protein n=1 Tax=Aeromicrobium sp. CF3.5 TaxID=3373078 RepID=UPI003EE66000
MTGDATTDENRARRWYAPTVLGLLAAGGMAFLASSRQWANATVASDGLPSDTIEITGSQALPLMGALALVVVTAALAVLATGGRMRRGVGIITVLAAAGGLWVVITGGGSIDRAFADAVEQSPAFTGGDVPPFSQSVLWPVVAAAAFAIAVALGVVTVAMGHRWSAMSRRYEAPTGAAPTRPKTEADIWKALDEGRDPTE